MRLLNQLNVNINPTGTEMAEYLEFQINDRENVDDSVWLQTLKNVSILIYEFQ